MKKKNRNPGKGIRGVRDREKEASFAPAEGEV